MKRLLTILLMTGLVLSTCGSLTAQTEDHFAAGNRLYQGGEFQQALNAYQQILDSGVHNSSLYFNMGNCYYKLQNIGQTILAYEKALKLNPGDEDVAANLAIANLAVIDRVTPLEKHFLFKLYDGYIFALKRPVLWICTGAAYLLAMLFLIIRIISRNSGLRFISSRVVIVSLILLAVFGLALIGQIRESKNRVDAVVLVEKVSVKSAPSDDSAMELFSLHEGTKVRIDQRTGDWVEIVLADGKVGWVLKDVVGII